jgi:lysozyme
MPKLNTDVIRRVAGAGAVAIALFTSGFEGYSNAVYKDPAGISTVCVGHARTGPDGKPLQAGQRESDEVCSYLLGQDIATAEKALHASVTVPLSDGETLAYTDFIFNAGTAAWRGSSMRSELNAGRHTAACNRLLAWDKATVKGKQVVLPGLQKRRQAEVKACLGTPAA